MPATGNAIDNRQMIAKALNLIAAMEDKSIEEVSEEIANLGSDFLRPKIISPANAPSIPLMEIKSAIDQYRRACDAHRDEKKISIIGIPEKKRRFLYLTSPKDFKVLCT